MGRKKTDNVPEVPVEPMVIVIIGGKPVKVRLPDIIHDPKVFNEGYVSDAIAMQLYHFKQGRNQDKTPIVFGPRPDGKYAITGFRSN